MIGQLSMLRVAVQRCMIDIARQEAMFVGLLGLNRAEQGSKAPSFTGQMRVKVPGKRGDIDSGSCPRIRPSQGSRAARRRRHLRPAWQ